MISNRFYNAYQELQSDWTAQGIHKKEWLLSNKGLKMIAQKLGRIGKCLMALRHKDWAQRVSGKTNYFAASPEPRLI